MPGADGEKFCYGEGVELCFILLPGGSTGKGGRKRIREKWGNTNSGFDAMGIGIPSRDPIRGKQCAVKECAEKRGSDAGGGAQGGGKGGGGIAGERPVSQGRQEPLYRAVLFSLRCRKLEPRGMLLGG